MFVKRKFSRFISKEFNDAVWAEICDVAVRNKIRLYLATDRSEQKVEGRLSNVIETQRSSYVSSRSRLNINTRDWYMQSLLKIFPEQPIDQTLDMVTELLDAKVKSGIIYPWDHLRFKVDRFHLPHLDERDYRGKVLRLRSQNGVIKDITIKRLALG